MKSKMLAVILLSCATMVAQVHQSMQLMPYTACVKPTCDPGGNPVGPTSTINKLSGSTLELGVAGASYVNALFWHKLGKTNANNFVAIVEYNIPASTFAASQAFEQDVFVYNAPYRLMAGTECVVAPGSTKRWQIWDDLHNNWIDTKYPCNFTPGKNTWTYFFHRIPGDTSCSGLPCVYNDMIVSNGVPMVINQAEPGSLLPLGWISDSGLNIQLDIGANAASLFEYVTYAALIEF